MDTLDATTLPGLPAPFWFIQLFKVLGFVMHMVPMHLWFAGFILALILLRRRGTPAAQWGRRMVSVMPVVIAFGVNFGIVPLLFVQVAYPWAFYPATILVAWFWLAIVLLLIPAYYGVYAYTFGLKREQGPAAWQTVFGWVSAGLFIVLGLLFAHGFSLVASPGAWKELWMSQEVGGAVTGTAHFFGSATVWARWSMMFGLAILTTAAWTVLDAGVFAPKDDHAYRRWAPQFAWKLALVGAVWVAATGSWYVFGTWPEAVSQVMWSGPWAVLTLLTGISPAVLVAVLTWRRNQPADALAAGGAVAAQLLVLSLNGISRQVVQNLELKPLAEVWSQPLDVQWSPLIAFLLAFVFGACVIAWMIAQVVKLPGQEKEKG